MLAHLHSGWQAPSYGRNLRKPLIFCNYVNEEENTMLETIAVILIVLWLVGLVSSYTLGGFIHVLLVLAVITIILRLLRGGKV